MVACATQSSKHEYRIVEGLQRPVHPFPHQNIFKFYINNMVEKKGRRTPPPKVGFCSEIDTIKSSTFLTFLADNRGWFWLQKVPKMLTSAMSTPYLGVEAPVPPPLYIFSSQMESRISSAFCFFAYVHLSFFACHFRIQFRGAHGVRISPKNTVIYKRYVEKCVDIFFCVFRRISPIIPQILIKYYRECVEYFKMCPTEMSEIGLFWLAIKNKWTYTKLWFWPKKVPQMLKAYAMATAKPTPLAPYQEILWLFLVIIKVPQILKNNSISYPNSLLSPPILLKNTHYQSRKSKKCSIL